MLQERQYQLNTPFLMKAGILEDVEWMLSLNKLSLSLIINFKVEKRLQRLNLAQWQVSLLPGYLNIE